MVVRASLMITLTVSTNSAVTVPIAATTPSVKAVFSVKFKTSVEPAPDVPPSVVAVLAPVMINVAPVPLVTKLFSTVVVAPPTMVT